MPGWLDPVDVSAYLGIPAPDQLVVDATEAAESWVELHRSDLDWSTPTLGTTPEGPHVYSGSVMFAALNYQARNSPEGFAGFDDAGGVIGIGDSAAMSRVYRLIRGRRPKVG